ncbi:MAG: UPF0489 family protein [Gammaproteobacteria bacterium]|nr:UPF0489 family protein [Gammaproteobacteria bacterium]MBU1416001.1 UPF0489 family protein [Gammaproteobacteria bacterium]
MKDDDFLLPPGCKSSILPHPSGDHEAVEVAVFQEHRYAFFFWAKWTRELKLAAEPPALITLDWHEDLGPVDDREKRTLRDLDLDDARQVALHCWEGLCELNDGQISAAAYLNLVGDIYVLRKQTDTVEDEFVDAGGQTHRVRCFDSAGELMKFLADSNISRVYFDVDLDYFTESPDMCGGGPDVKLVTDKVVREILDPEGNLLRWVFNRLAGVTIATEPEFCGGVVASNRLMTLLSESLFDPQLLSDAPTWRHLSSAPHQK